MTGGSMASGAYTDFAGVTLPSLNGNMSYCVVDLELICNYTGQSQYIVVNV